ncbi:hypothetical protein N7E02_13870 [Aliirhizobium terrae]|uniref:hypothetical protein n=1 Tax=Terrirhizobium terrae TaxID=2926709 RepID=UPI002577982A|nr:hypothetical protein [Rhizobium sp. CC-CFT758]WJH41452.1 hypothetical protein N7E02_13870 [Rhizobium sp. CC-CFT758]
MIQPRDAPLPALREDLQIMRVGASYSGAPTWVVFDPIRNRFFRITYEMFQVLSSWRISGTVGNLLKTVDSRFGNLLTVEDIGTIVRMLEHNLLLVQPTRGAWRALHQKSQPRHSWFMRLIHNYLFFKIPLVRPESFIRRTWPYVAFLFSKVFWFISALAGLAGLYLVSRQWDAFVGTFPSFSPGKAQRSRSCRSSSSSACTSSAMPMWRIASVVAFRPWVSPSWSWCRCSIRMSAMPGS